MTKFERNYQSTSKSDQITAIVNYRINLIELVWMSKLQFDLFWLYYANINKKKDTKLAANLILKSPLIDIYKYWERVRACFWSREIHFKKLNLQLKLSSRQVKKK